VSLVLTTARLCLREFTLDDAPFVLRIVNEPSWLEGIGDRGVRTLDDARAYLTNGPLAMYARHGFGLWAVELRGGNAPLGMCGLVRRDALPDVDLGYALLPEHCGRGYAREAAAGCLAHARERLGLGRVIAITAPDNAASQRVLVAVGMRAEGSIDYPSAADPSTLFGWGAAAAPPPT
jgi:ribosomal-protein-alanine N-acetyltransferase